MIVALDTDAAEDLRPLSAWLRAQGVPHRVWEESGRLRLAVPDERFLPAVEVGLSRLRAGDLVAGAGAPERGPGLTGTIARQLAAAPVTALLLGLALLAFPIANAGLPALEGFMLRWLMIVPIEPVGEFIYFPTLGETLRSGALWRLWTPALLHFGAVHLAFNMLWLWEFGRRLEAGLGRARYVEAVVVVAALANVAQYFMDEGPRFGGLSGLVYGLLGYLVVAGRRSDHPAFRLPAALVLMFVVVLVFFSTGATETFGLFVANGAHWGGFLAGVLLALVRVRGARPSEPSS